MEFCRQRLHCCACQAKQDLANEEQPAPARVVQSEEVLPPLLRINTARPSERLCKADALKTPKGDAGDERRVSSAMLVYNRPVELPSNGSRRNFEPIITLRSRDPDMAMEDRRLTLGGDQRYMTDPSRMRYSEDVANRNMLSNSSNVYPNPNPSAGKSLPLSVGPGRYGEDVADRVISQANSLHASIHTSAHGSIPSPGSEMDIRIVSRSSDTEDYYTSRFKPTQDAYTPEQRNSAERRLLGLRSLGSSDEGMLEHDSARRDRPSVDSQLSSDSADKDKSKCTHLSLDSKKSSSGSVTKRSTDAPASSGVTPLSPQEMERKEVNRMVKDNFYDSRAAHPLGRVNTSGSSCPVESKSKNQEGANEGSALNVTQPKFEQQVSPMHSPSIALKGPTPDLSAPSALPPAIQQEVASSSPDPSAESNQRQNTLRDAQRCESTSTVDGVSAKDVASQSTSDNSKSTVLTPAARPITPATPGTHVVFDHILPFFHPEIVPPAEVFASERASQSSPTQDKDKDDSQHPPLQPSQRLWQPTLHEQPGTTCFIQDTSLPAPVPEPPPATGTAAGLAAGEIPLVVTTHPPTAELRARDLKTGKTWPIKFDTESGGYEGLEDVVAEKRRRMVVGGLFRRTDTVDRAMPGSWFDGAVKG